MRFLLALIIGGGFVSYMGWQEYQLLDGVSDTPEVLDLAELETRSTLDNPYINLKEHWRVYPGSVFSYEVPKNASSDEALPEYKVTETYYPVISMTHPFFLKLAALQMQYGDLDAVPDEEYPDVGNFKVLVKTDAFKQVRDVPDDWMESEGVEGMVINAISSLSQEEEALIRESFPSVDMSSVLILEEGRKPKALSTVLGMMIGGALFSLLMLGIMVKGRSRSTTPA